MKKNFYRTYRQELNTFEKNLDIVHFVLSRFLTLSLQGNRGVITTHVQKHSYFPVKKRRFNLQLAYSRASN